MYQRQDSNSKINVLVTMDNNATQVVPTCTKYDNIPTFVLDDLTTVYSQSDGGSARGTAVINEASVNDFISTIQTSTYRTDAIFTNSNNDSVFIETTREDNSTSASEDRQQSMDLNSNLDPRLLDITRQALVNGSLTPLIKEELKCSIQSKRLKQGKQEMKVEFTEPPPDELTPEEQERVEKRKVQNRMAARRFRDKQKSRADYLQKQCQRMESEQADLRRELAQVKQERDQLKEAWTDHMTRCPWNQGMSMTVFSQHAKSSDT